MPRSSAAFRCGLLLRGIAGVALVISICACASEPIDPSPQGVYMARCVRCHEVDGSSTTASQQADRAIDMRSAEFQRGHSDAEIIRIAIYGEGRMQGISGLTDEQADSVVVHVRRLAAPEGLPTP